MKQVPREGTVWIPHNTKDTNDENTLYTSKIFTNDFNFHKFKKKVVIYHLASPWNQKLIKKRATWTQKLH